MVHRLTFCGNSDLGVAQLLLDVDLLPSAPPLHDLQYGLLRHQLLQLRLLHLHLGWLLDGLQLQRLPDLHEPRRLVKVDVNGKQLDLKDARLTVGTTVRFMTSEEAPQQVQMLNVVLDKDKK